MEGIFFYWIIWLSWITVTFFGKKSMERFFLSHFLLLLIITVKYSINIFSFEINIALLLMLLFSLHKLIEVKFMKLCYFLFATISFIAFATSIRLLYLYDPIIAIIDPIWMKAVLNFIFIAYIIREQAFQIPLFIVGMSLSEIIYSIFLANIYGGQKIGDFVFFDIVAITIFLLFVWNSFANFTVFLSKVTKNKTTSIGS